MLVLSFFLRMTFFYTYEWHLCGFSSSQAIWLWKCWTNVEKTSSGWAFDFQTYTMIHKITLDLTCTFICIAFLSFSFASAHEKKSFLGERNATNVWKADKMQQMEIFYWKNELQACASLIVWVKATTISVITIIIKW